MNRVFIIFLLCMCSTLADAQYYHFQKGEEFRNIDWRDHAFKEYVEGMKIGEAASALNVADCYFNEYGTPRNVAKGQEILDAWAKKDVTICEYAINYYSNSGCPDKFYNRHAASSTPNYSKALQFMNIYKSKTGKTYPLLGDFYLKGHGVVPIDTLKAIDFAIQIGPDNCSYNVTHIIYQYGMNSTNVERLDLLEEKYPEYVKCDYIRGEPIKDAFAHKKVELGIAKISGAEDLKIVLSNCLDLPFSLYDTFEFHQFMKGLYKYATTDEQKKLIDATRTAKELVRCVRNGYDAVDFWSKVPGNISNLRFNDYYDYYTEDLLTTEDKNKYDFLNQYILKNLDYNGHCTTIMECITYDLYKHIIKKWDEEHNMDSNVCPVKVKYDRAYVMQNYMHINSQTKDEYIRDIKYNFLLESKDKLPYAEKYLKIAENHIDSLVNLRWGEAILVTDIIRGEDGGFVYGQYSHDDLEGYKTYAAPSLYKQLIEEYPNSEWYQYAVSTLPLAEEYQTDLDAYTRAIAVSPETQKEEINEIKNAAASKYMKKRVFKIVSVLNKGKDKKECDAVLYPMPKSVYVSLHSR